jgi:hypothetical protein
MLQRFDIAGGGIVDDDDRERQPEPACQAKYITGVCLPVDGGKSCWGR